MTRVTGPSLTSSTCIMAPKRPVAVGAPERPHRPDEGFVERFGDLRRGGADETRPAALAAIAVQRELTDDQNASADVGHAEIHFVVGVAEDAQTDHLVGEPLRLGGRVRRRDAQQHEETRADGADDFIAHGHPRGSDSLHDGSHGRVLLFVVRVTASG